MVTQLFALIFAFVHGLHNIPSVNSFSEHGNSQNSLFHWTGGFLRVMFLLALYCTMRSHEYTDLECIILSISNAFIMWIAFNTTVNLGRKGDFPWYYVGKKSKIDLAFPNGKLNIIVSAVIVAAANILILFVL
jgi:hypothetical protein